MPVDVGYFTGSISYQASYMSSPLIISIGTGPDSNGIAWVWEGLDGWDSPDVSGSIIQRSADHGGWPAPQYYAPRVLTLRLFASAANQATRDLARALLQQVIPVNDLAILTYNEPIPKLVQFRRSGRIQEVCETLTDVAFTCNITAPDPRKYATVQFQQPAGGGPAVNYLTIPATVAYTMPNNVPPGSTIATNFGTFETRPVITVWGPVTAPALVNATTGQKVSYSTVTLAAGDQLVVNFDSRTGLKNNVYVPADISSSWWVLQPGPVSIQLQGNPVAGGSFTAVWRSAFI